VSDDKMKDLMAALDSCEWIRPDSEVHPEFQARLVECGSKLMRYNSTPFTLEAMRAAFEDVTGRDLDPSSLVIFPFRCDLGFNVHIGKDVLVNYNCTFLDTARITIGDHTKIGPDSHLVTADHPRDYLERRTHTVRGRPIRIGEDCWLGANVTVLPGVTIGDRCIIGAGSVVTKDVPDDSVYAGNPAHDISGE